MSHFGKDTIWRIISASSLVEVYYSKCIVILSFLLSLQAITLNFVDSHTKKGKKEGEDFEGQRDSQLGRIFYLFILNFIKILWSTW